MNENSIKNITKSLVKYIEIDGVKYDMNGIKIDTLPSDEKNIILEPLPFYFILDEDKNEIKKISI